MKKHRWIKKGFCGLLVGLLFTQTVTFAKAEEPEGMKKGDLFIQERLFSTDTKEVGSDKFEGSITVDGKRYLLQEVKQEVVDQTPVKIETPVEKTIDSEPMDTEYEPEQTIEKDGVTYTLEKVEEKEKQEVTDQTVTGYTDYDKAVTRASVPATKQVTVKDNQTGENKTVTCTLTDVTPLAEGGWEDTHIDITFILDVLNTLLHKEKLSTCIDVDFAPSPVVEQSKERIKKRIHYFKQKSDERKSKGQ